MSAPPSDQKAVLGARRPGPADSSAGASAGVRPGIHPSIVYGDRRNPFADQATAIVQGRHLFIGYNCYGCHGGRAGGGMGPSLRDSTWIYGSSDIQIFASIVEGRPAGMPAWGARLPEDHIWELVTYIRSLRTPQEPDQVTVK